MFATIGWRWRTILRKQSAQLAQCAPLMTLTTLANPNLPCVKGNEAVTCDNPTPTGTFMIWRKHSRESCVSANDSVNSVWTPLTQKFALVVAHVGKINHTDCGSGTAGMRSINSWRSSEYCSKNHRTNRGCPTAMPKIFTSCWASSNVASPLQHFAPGLISYAALVSSSTPTGVTPPRFHTCILPWCILICVWVKISASKIRWTSSTLCGAQIIQKSADLLSLCLNEAQCSVPDRSGMRGSLPQMRRRASGETPGGSDALLPSWEVPQSSRSWRSDRGMNVSLPQMRRRASQGNTREVLMLLLPSWEVPQSSRSWRSDRTPRHASMDTTAARSSLSVMVCSDAHPAFVVETYWKGDVAFSAFLAICFAMVLATNILMMSPTTIPHAIIVVFQEPWGLLVWDCSLCHDGSHICQQYRIAFTVKHKEKVIRCHSWRTLSPPCCPNGDEEQILIPCMRDSGTFVGNVRTTLAGVWRPPFRVGQLSQRRQRPWGHLCSFQRPLPTDVFQIENSNDDERWNQALMKSIAPQRFQAHFENLNSEGLKISQQLLVRKNSFRLTNRHLALQWRPTSSRARPLWRISNHLGPISRGASPNRRLSQGPHRRRERNLRKKASCTKEVQTHSLGLPNRLWEMSVLQSLLEERSQLSATKPYHWTRQIDHPWHVGWEQCDTNRGRMSLGHPKPKNHQNITTNRNGTQQRTMRSFLSDPDALIDPTPAKIVPTLPDRYCLRRTSPNLKGTKSISATLIKRIDQSDRPTRTFPQRAEQNTFILECTISRETSMWKSCDLWRHLKITSVLGTECSLSCPSKMSNWNWKQFVSLFFVFVEKITVRHASVTHRPNEGHEKERRPLVGRSRRSVNDSRDIGSTNDACGLTAFQASAICCMNCPTSCRSSVKIRSMKVFLQSHGETLRRRIETLLNELPMESRAKVEPGSGKHSVFTHFPKDPNCDICLKTKITRASCRWRAGTVVPRAENVGDLTTADNKILSEECGSRHSHRHAVVLKDVAIQWLQSYPYKTKTSEETQKSLMKFLEPMRKPEVIYTDNS